MTNYKAVILDIDGTITDSVSWTKLTEELGASSHEHEKIFAEFLNGNLSYELAKRNLIDLWQSTGNANKKYISKLFRSWVLKDTAVTLIHYLQNKGYHVCLITGSVDLFAETIAERLSIQDYYYNTELVWEGDKLIDFHYEKNQAQKKLDQFRKYIEKHGLASKECVVIGDSENDVKLFEETGNGIAMLPADDALIDVAWKTVDDLEQLRDIL